MARPRRNTAEAFYDVFADFSIEDQAAALKILEQVHRLAVRESKAKPAQRPSGETGEAILFGGPDAKEFPIPQPLRAK